MFLRENTQEENFPTLPEGSRAPYYDHVYKNGFKDTTPSYRPVNIYLKTILILYFKILTLFYYLKAGILTYAPGENVREYLKYQPFSAPAQTKATCDRFYHYNQHPKLGETRVHYGKANDPHEFLDMTHGVRSDEKSYVSFLNSIVSLGY